MIDATMGLEPRTGERERRAGDEQGLTESKCAAPWFGAQRRHIERVRASEGGEVLLSDCVLGSHLLHEPFGVVRVILATPATVVAHRHLISPGGSGGLPRRERHAPTVTAEVVHFACFVHVLNKNYDDTKKAEVHQPAQRPPLGRDTDSKTTAHRLYQVKLL